MSPTGTIKDRAAREIIKKFKLHKSKNISVVDATSGSAGVSMASFCASLGIACVLFVARSTPVEKILLMRLAGAKIHFIDDDSGLQGARAQAKRFAVENNGFLFTDQLKHSYLDHTLAREIKREKNLKKDAFVSLLASGSTLYSIYRAKIFQNLYAAKIGSDIEDESIGMPMPLEDFFGTEMFKRNTLRFIEISHEEVIETAKTLSTIEGLLCGPSTAANIAAAIKLAKTDEMTGKSITSIAPSGASQYFSSAIFQSP